MNSSNYDPGDEAEDDLAGYLNIYLDETEEQLDDLIETMLVLEQEPQNEVSLNGAFRLLHSMKGAAGMMGFDQITVLTHHLETRFERLRSGRIELDRITMNLTLRCIDFLRECNGRLRAGNELSTPDVLLEELRELEERAEKQVQSEIADEAYHLPDLGADYHLLICFQRHVQLKDLKFQTVVARLGNLGEIKATRPDLDDSDSVLDMDSFDVILNTIHPHEQMLEAVRLDGVQRVELRVPRDADAEPLAVWELTPVVAQDATEVAVAIIAAEPPVIETPVINTPATPLPSIERSQPEHTAEPEKASTPTKSASGKVVETVRVDIDRLDSLMNLAGELVVNRAQFIQVSEEIGPGLRKSSTVTRSREFCDSLVRTIAKLKEHQEQSSAAGAEWTTHIRELESGLQLMQANAKIWEDSRRCFSHLDEAIDQLSRVSDSLQRGVLGTRMIPVGPLFNRFKRVIRDLSQERGKQVDLVIDGESTELDKRMIDALGDPLVHLVRNSIDHGLETIEKRIAAGKSPAGMISLSAKHRGNHVYIMVRDDGGGINVDKIRKSLVSKHGMTVEQADRLSADEVIQTIFQPGFSTADSITDVSGRGVGMDIVRARVEELSGSIEIETVLGEGTTFTLKMPLTLAIIGSLLVRIRGIVFAIPKDDVREIVSIATDKIISVNGKQTFAVRGEYTPLVCINTLFRWNQSSSMSEPVSPPASGHTEIAILQSGGRPMGLRVDQSIGSQDVVIKSLEENFVGIQGLAGASILGNGAVALMLDVAALQKMASAK